MAKFKAIIIGGGPVGLYLAHALQASDIDYVLFEQRPTIPPPTAFGILLWPHVMRLFHQVGLLEKLEKIGTQMTSTVYLKGDGSVLRENVNFTNIAER